MDSNSPQPYSQDVPSGKSNKASKRRRKEEIAEPDSLPKNLPGLAFVVQFRYPTEPGSARFAGRAEHIMSGENTEFGTPEELVDFFGRVMNQLKPRSQKGRRQ
jgi:hypothetical protein